MRSQCFDGSRIAVLLTPAGSGNLPGTTVPSRILWTESFGSAHSKPLNIHFPFWMMKLAIFEEIITGCRVNGKVQRNRIQCSQANGADDLV